jgi:hypothetical protein
VREAHAVAGDYFRNELLCYNADWAPGYLTDGGLGDVLRRSSPWKVGYAPDGWAGPELAVESAVALAREQAGALVEGF